MNMRCVFKTQRHSQRTQLLDELHLLVTLLFPRYPPLSAAFAMALFSSPSPPPQPTSAESIPQTRGSWADWLDEERAEHRGMSVEEYNLLMARDFKLFGLSTENIEWLQSGVVNGRCSIPATKREETRREEKKATKKEETRREERTATKREEARREERTAMKREQTRRAEWNAAKRGETRHDGNKAMKNEDSP